MKTAEKEITFNPHLFNRESKRRLSLEKIKETIRTGKVNVKKSKYPKSCITRYYGK